MYPPQVGQTGRVKPLASFWRRPEHLGRPADIVLKQPGFRQRASDLNLFVPVKARLTKAADQKGSRFRPHSPLKGPNGLNIEISR